mmetsp:Transcript_10100/g.37626  ORF Transcript_10100/g.37626 Transcript_10100/m.37626 type:complete len:153 (-) Transcript_10100:238-696(-)|eukprot:CAMPEP_0117450366 /NCGR_PEP_ID=MMETSP0759-20121206/8430_1 /TAXON_ID=63605 /ORGANISM="Percolomonas cosmopolitus, Strain WS" /LENGTH=152 /DNA_ID=CAMNT_0005242883 /DNA_START=1 /DNA_END=459 /DNA_ORIENTATION=+
MSSRSSVHQSRASSLKTFSQPHLSTSQHAKESTSLYKFISSHRQRYLFLGVIIVLVLLFPMSYALIYFIVAKVFGWIDSERLREMSEAAGIGKDVGLSIQNTFKLLGTMIWEHKFGILLGSFLYAVYLGGVYLFLEIVTIGERRALRGKARE